LIKRRQFIKLLSGATLAPFVSHARAQDTPIIGVLGSTSLNSAPIRYSEFNRGLREAGYEEGRNVAVEYRMADGHPRRFPELAADLVRRQVAVIATNGGSVAALAAKAATSTIPIVFTTGDDPVGLGLVKSLSHPGGNMTGVSVSSTELIEKRLELLRELLPAANSIALLLARNSHTPHIWNEHATIAAKATGLRVISLEVESENDFQMAFASAVQQGADALFVAAVPFFLRERSKIVVLAAHHSLPAIYSFSEFTEAGGLMSYGPDLRSAYFEAGRYTGRILNGAAPGDLPVQLPSRFELVINLKTAQALGLKISRLLNARADKVIE
jgi:putative ABC transport system substrate-binding protein